MHPYFMRGLGFGPTVMGRLIKQLPYDEHDLIAEEGRFSPREVVAHLADWEPLLLARIKLAVESPGAAVEVFDEGEMAIRNNYASKDIFEELTNWMGARQRTVEYVGSLTKEDLQKTVEHPELGTQSAYDMASMLVSHDMYHIEQISAYLTERISPSVQN